MFDTNFYQIQTVNGDRNWLENMKSMLEKMTVQIGDRNWIDNFVISLDLAAALPVPRSLERRQGDRAGKSRRCSKHLQGGCRIL